MKVHKDVLHENSPINMRQSYTNNKVILNHTVIIIGIRCPAKWCKCLWLATYLSPRCSQLNLLMIFLQATVFNHYSNTGILYQKKKKKKGIKLCSADQQYSSVLIVTCYHRLSYYLCNRMPVFLYF